MYIFSKTHFLKYVSPYFFTLIRPCFSLFAIFSFLSFFSTALFAQNNLQIQVLSEEGEALIGASASVKNAPTIGATADENGNLTLTDIPNGAQTITVSFLGYEPQERTLGFPRAASSPLLFKLAEKLGTLEEVVISTNRSGRDIEAIPTRIEAIKDEVEEGVMMAPATASHVLTHVAGVQLQTTSATSATSNVRIQGLSGRYTQILQDGFPLYGGLGGSLGILQIPPVDLQQVEFLKGSASTLYGSGAIAGVINLVSKRPELGNDETTVHLNGSQLGQFDANVFVRQQLNQKLGFSVMASHNLQKPFDVNGDGFTELPQITRSSFTSRLFWELTPRTKAIFSLGLTDEFRDGGDLMLVEGRTPDSTHFYRETNKTNRINTTVDFTHTIDSLNRLQFRNIVSLFNRQINLNEYIGETRNFSGKQATSFSEIAWKHNHVSKKHHSILGLNLNSNFFAQARVNPTIKPENYLDEGFNTFGVFGQHDWDITNKFAVEAGLRIDNSDYHKDKNGVDVFVLPRVAALYRVSSKWNTRLSAGLGYRLPTVFEQESEVRGFQNVLPLRGGATEAERSQGVNLDVTYRTPIGKEVFFTWNQLFFYTKIDAPIVFARAIRNGATREQFEMQNLDGYMDTKGLETNLKFTFGHFNIYAGYVYTDPKTYSDGKAAPFTLTSKHVVKTDFVWEVKGKYMVGLDCDYRTAQTLASGRVVPSLFTAGFLLRYTYRNIDFYFNTENITNQRQTQLDGTVLSAPYNTPQYTEIWAPQEGFVYNFGIRANLVKVATKKK